MQFDTATVLWGALTLDGETNRLISPEDAHEFVGPGTAESETPLAFTCVGTHLKLLTVSHDGSQVEHHERRLWLSRRFVAPALCPRSGAFCQPSCLELPAQEEGDPAKTLREHPHSRVAEVCEEALRGGAMPCMQTEECEELVRYLSDTCGQHPCIKLLTFNGVSFDMRLLRRWCDDPDAASCCVSLALDSVDPCFQMLCERGFPVSLDAMCRGAGIQGKTGEGCSAPADFASACPERVIAMFAYCMNDVSVTLGLYETCLRDAKIAWVTKKSTVGVHRLLHITKYDRPHMASVSVLLRSAYPDLTWSYPKRVEADGGGRRDPDAAAPVGEDLLPTRWKFVSWMFT